MKARLVITSIWLASFVLCLLVIESYVHMTTDDGLRILLPEDRVPTMTPVIALFGSYLAGILGFWFAKPFKNRGSNAAETVRFWLAAVCTLVFISVLLYFVTYAHIFGPGEETISQNISTGVKVAGLMSFIVAPINFYYFGMSRITMPK